MYAVIETGGKQFRVEEGSRFNIVGVEAEVGSELVLDKVLLLGGESLSVGKPYLENAKVKAQVLAHKRGEKILIFKKWRRNDSRRSQGYREHYSTLEITSISA
ncbi:MAG: 50S ribosomal protein L21 [Desulfovibrio sp.]|jgi:large subunit ribosomal protein L21|nr:50S ribosomal protein L21 [Desulfovibrio sp.]